MKIPFFPLAGMVCFALVVGCGAAEYSRAAAPDAKVVYQWNPENFLEKVKAAPNNPWKAEMVARPDGSQALSVSGTGAGYNNYIFVSPGKLVAGREYTAIVKYEIVEPTKFPDSFYMFARSKKLGMAHDYWQYWNGDPGDKGVAKLTMSLKGIKQSDDWVFHVGCKGPGTMIIDSFQIVEGHGLEFTPATVAVKPIAFTLPTTIKLPTGAQPFEVEAPKPAKVLRLAARDFGLVSDGANGPVSPEVAAANFTAISAVLKACREQKASELVIAPGVYRFISNAAIPIVDLSDLVIDGQGAEFIFQKLRTGVEAVSMQRCQRVVIKNLKLDWDWNVTPIASLARVLSVAPDGKSCEVAFPDLTEPQIEAVKKAPWHSMIAFDPSTLTRKGFERTSVAVAGFENVDAKTLRVNFKSPVTLTVGETYCVRHLYYEMGAFKVGFSNNLLFDGVTIYSMPGMGWFFTGDMKNWKLVNCKVARREDSRNPLTTAADGFHVSQSQGNLAVENCEFTGSGDDSINIHDNCFQGVRRVDASTLSLINCPPWRLRIQEGDKLELFKSDYTPLGFTSEVKTVVYKENNTTVTLADTLPADLSPLSIVLNRRYDTHNVRIANNKFHDASGRQILLSARNATIENNLFENAVGTAIQFHTEIVGNLWAEGNGASNVVVRGNTFENTSFEGRYENAVIYAGAKLPVGVTSYPLFHDLLIEKNRFINSSGPAVSLYSAKNVVVRDNEIASPNTPATANYLASTLHTAYTTDIVLSGNVWQKATETSKAGVYYDAATTSGLTINGSTLSN